MDPLLGLHGLGLERASERDWTSPEVRVTAVIRRLFVAVYGLSFNSSILTSFHRVNVILLS